MDIYIFTHNDDLNRNGEGDFLAVARAQFFHADQYHRTDQGKHQRGDVGFGQALAHVHQSLKPENTENIQQEERRLLRKMRKRIDVGPWDTILT